MLLLQTPPVNVSYDAILPILMLSVVGVMSLLYGFFTKDNKEKIELAVLNTFGLILSGYAIVRFVRSAPILPVTTFNGMLVIDQLAVVFSFIFLIVALLTVLASVHFLEKEDLPGEEYYALLMFATVGMMLMAMAGDMVMIFLGLEISSIATYVMAGYRRKDLRSNESALKYFILGSFSTAFLLYGMALIYGATGSTNLEAIRGIIKGGLNVASQQPVSTELLFIGVAMMLIGFGFKIAGVPFHLWAPDVYEGAPTPVAGFMAAGSKAAAFAAFLRVFSLTFSEAASFDLHATWVTTLQIIAVLTMTLGNAVAITQTNIKRMLAYSSIAHAGYVLVGFIAGDWGAVAFYMLAYSVMNIGAFTIISLFTGEGDKKLQLSDYAGWGFKSMGLSIALLIFMLSMAGVPATGGFIGKFLVFRAAWDKGFHLLVIIAVLNSAASVYYYLRPMVSLFFQEGKADDNPPRMPITIGFAVTLALIGTFYLGVAPGWLIRWLEVAKSVIN